MNRFPQPPPSIHRQQVTREEREEEEKQENERDPLLSMVSSYFDHHLFLVEDLLQVAEIDTLELSIFCSATLCSVLYAYPSFQIEEHHTKSDLIEFYHATSDPRYKLFQMLINGLTKKGVELYWLQAPIFFGQL